MLGSLARLIARRPRLVVLLWVLAAGGGYAAATGVVGEGLFAQLSSGAPTAPGEAQDGAALLDDSSDDGTSVTTTVLGVDPADPALTAPLESLRSDLGGRDDVASVADPSALAAGPGGSAAAAPLLAVDGDGLLVVVDLVPGLDGARGDAALAAVDDRLAEFADEVTADVPGARVATSSTPQLVEAITGQVETDLRTGESIALPLSLLVMVVVFGGLLAAGLPLVGAIASIAGGLASLLGFAHLIDLDATVVNVVTVLGLGLCIDYGLLVVSRFREELHGRTTADAELDAAAERALLTDALAATLSTAGRTVTFSAVTVAISIAGLMVFEADILQAMGAAGMSVVVVAWVVALTLVPALMMTAGRRLLRPGVLHRVPGLRRIVDRLGDVPPEHGSFSRLASRVQRRPWLVFGAVVVVLLVAAAPALGLQLRSSGIELLPVDHPEREFYDELAREFPASQAAPVTVVAATGEAKAGAWASGLAQLDGVRAVDPVRTVGDYAVVGVRVEGDDPGGATAVDVVHEIRSDRPDFATWVTGQAAYQADFTDSLAERVPWAAGLVVLVTFVLLFLMTGSVLIPLKALLMNVVSLGASLGVLVWGFEDGHLAGLLDFTPTGGIETVIPPLVLAFGFGLAMDYEVFLLSRVKELRDAGLPNDQAVAQGLQRSGRIITSAALIVVLVFSGFVVGDLLVIKQTGVALAVAVAVDATLVRVLLVPATMTLLGEWNWWAPAPLRRLHERIGVSE